MEILNIVSLIETNPITKLSSDYNVKLLEKIKENFTDTEQQLFLFSFYCYLNCHPTNDYVIDLDDVWKWIGFNQKVKAKLLLEKYFKYNVDYINSISLAGKQDSCIKQHGGQNKAKFLLNINAFKLFCLLAETKKSKELHKYFIKLENLLHELLEEESKELKQKLLMVEKNSLYEKQKAVEQAIIVQFPLNTECIYFGTIENTTETNEKLIKFGHTNDLATRILDHRKKYNNFILIEAFRVQNKVEIENLIKTHIKIKKQIRTLEINGKNKTEIIAYNDTTFTISNLSKYIKDIIHSKTYSIDNFNKLLKQNEELLKDNEELKNAIKDHNDIITKQNLEIHNLKDELLEKNRKINLLESEHNIIQQHPLLTDDEQTNKFNKFVDKMCIVSIDVEETSTNMEGAYRIWNNVKPTKETFHAFKNYLDIRFKSARLSTQNKNQVVYGYIGVKLKQIDYKKQFINNDLETFIFQVCNFSPSGKILNSTLLSEFQRWKQNLNKEIDTRDMTIIKDYLNSCEYVVKATVWTDKGSNEGYYGISLKIDEYNHRITSSTGKKVEKIEVSSGQVLNAWETIAKAAEFENVSAAKMSRSIKNKIIYNNYYYRTL
jgi:phage anti-repressor protein